MFQNCGKSNTDSFSTTAMNDGFDVEDAKVINTEVGKNVVFTVPSDKLAILQGSRGSVCKWHFKGADGEVIEIDNSGYEYSINGIEMSEGGRYRLSCKTTKSKVVVVFAVIVRDPMLDQTKANLVMTTKLLDVNSTQTVNNITRSDAQAKCKSLADSKSAVTGVKCVWNSITIYERLENQNGNYKFVSMHKGKTDTTGLLAITQAEARTECDKSIEALLTATPNAGYKCSWRDAIFKQRAEIEPLKVFVGIKTVNEVESRFNSSNSITEANTIVICKNYAAANPLHGVTCYWDGGVVYKRTEPEPTGTLAAYYVIDLQNQLAKTKAGITKSAAKSECNALANANPSRNIRCYWNSTLLLTQYAGPTGTFIGKARRLILFEDVFAEVSNITKTEAYDRCMAYRSSTGKSVKCMWQGNVFYTNY